eukprot:3414456-Prymnesium_polylepis.1
MPRVKPGMVSGVTITMHDDEVDDFVVQKRWDATRSAAPAVSVTRMQKMVKDETRNELRNQQAFAKSGPPMWDIGERPAVAMPYIEYPMTAHPQAMFRSDVDYATAVKSTEPRYVARRKHKEALGLAAWASPLTQKYAPLGRMDNLTGDHVAPSRFTNGLVRLGGIRVIEPKAAGAKAVQTEEHKKIRNGESHEDYVRKGEYAYFSIEVPAGRALEVSLTALTGDPDLYVDCRWAARAKAAAAAVAAVGRAGRLRSRWEWAAGRSAGGGGSDGGEGGGKAPLSLRKLRLAARLPVGARAVGTWRALATQPMRAPLDDARAHPTRRTPSLV